MHHARPRSLTAALVAVAALLVSACSSGGASTAEPTVAAPTDPGAPGTRIEVGLTDALRIEPAAMTVPAGVPVTFVVTNTGSLEHEFFLGDEAAQAEHDAEMAESGGMGHDEPDGIAVPPGETKELTTTFAEPGTTLAGCHVAGHYQGGMSATITIDG